MNVLSNCLVKQMSAQNENEDVRRTSSEIDKPSLGLRSRKRRQNPQHSRIHTCLPYTSLETTFYPDRQESRDIGFLYQPQEQAVPDSIETFGRTFQYCSSSSSKEFTKISHETQNFSALPNTLQSSGRTSATDH